MTCALQNDPPPANDDDLDTPVSVVAARHRGWSLWTSRPYASRVVGNHHDHYDGYEESVLADDYRTLDERLTLQDQNDEAHAA